MKNTILFGALVTLICAQAQAEPQTTTTTTTTTPATQPAAQVTQPPTAVQAQPATSTAPPSQLAVINCDYKIPASTKVIDQTLVLNWSEKATTQAFDFTPAKLDEQIKTLQNCFTEQGWNGFNTALKQSGNMESIKTQNLTVSSQLDGQASMDEAKDNQWKLTLPLQVVYQNDKEKVTQLLSIKLSVSRKINGDLGITQMVATPRTNSTAQTSTSTTPPPVSTSTQTNTPAVTPPNDTSKAPTTVNPSGTPTTPTAGAPSIGDPSAQPGNTAPTPVEPQPATTTTPNP